MSAAAPTSSSRPRRRGLAALVLLLVLLVLAGGYGWHRWTQLRAADAQALQADRQRLQSLEERLDRLRRDQRAQAARLQQAEATNRLLREEMIGLGQRAALVEDSLQSLAEAEAERSAMPALTLHEVELLLSQGQQRLRLAGDLDGARKAYALAAQLLDDTVDPAWHDLRQALAQERAALDALGDDPGRVAATRLEAFAAALPSLPRQHAATTDASPWWRRALSRLVQVRPSADEVADQPADRAAGLAALRLELTLAQAAIERRDQDRYRAALARADGWLLRLWPESPERVRQRAALRDLRGQVLVVALPELGSTLAQLQRQREPR